MSQDSSHNGENEGKILNTSTESNIGTEPRDNADILPQDNNDEPCGCGGSVPLIKRSMDRSFIYAVGKIEPRFPSLGVEKEYLQAVGRSETKGQTDHEAMKTALSKRENRYLVRQMCWVLKIEGLETYIITPRDPSDFDMLVDALRAPPRGTDVDVVVGIRGPVATPEMCNGLMVPIVAFDQIYSFDVDMLIKAIPRPEKVDAKKFSATAEELLGKLMQMADNVGAADEHRALNYLSVRYNAIYANATEMHERNFQLDGVQVSLSPLSGTRKVVNVIFSYRNRNSDVVEKYFTRVDVTEEFPYLISKLAPYYDL